MVKIDRLGKKEYSIRNQAATLMNVAVGPVVKEDSTTRRDSGSFEIPMKPFFDASPFPSVYPFTRIPAGICCFENPSVSVFLGH